MSFAYVALLLFLRDVWIRTLGAALASRRATNTRGTFSKQLQQPNNIMKNPRIMEISPFGYNTLSLSNVKTPQA
jgi:hypothetical protein